MIGAHPVDGPGVHDVDSRRRGAPDAGDFPASGDGPPVAMGAGMPSSACARRTELASHLVRLGASGAAFAVGVHHDSVAIGALGSAGLVLGAFGLGHDLAHRVLALPRAVTSTLLSLSYLVMLSSGHGIAHTHRVHHRRPLADDDVEGRAARRSFVGALLHAPIDAWSGRVAGVRLARGLDRAVVVGENLAAVALAGVLASGLVPGGRIHLAVCLVAQVTIGLWASWIPHHAPGWLIALARPIARGPSLVARSLVHHDLHHARPDVPSAWLAGVAAAAIACAGCASSDAAASGAVASGSVSDDAAEIHRSILAGDPAAAEPAMRRIREREARALQSARDGIGVAVHLHRWHGRHVVDEVHTHVNPGESSYRAAVRFHDRYVLAVSVPIDVDGVTGAVRQLGPASVDLYEIGSIDPMPEPGDDRVSIAIARHLRLDEQQLHATMADVDRMLGEPAIQTAPHPLFHRAWWSLAGLAPR